MLPIIITNTEIIFGMSIFFDNFSCAMLGKNFVATKVKKSTMAGYRLPTR